MLRSALLAVLIVGLGLCGYLTYASLTASPVAGCGFNSSCHDVLNSEWSKWFTLPVSVVGFAVYASALGILAFTFFSIPDESKRQGEQFVVVLMTLAAVSAVWFIGIQAGVLGKYCPFCMGAHACSLIGAGLAWAAFPPGVRQATSAGVVSFLGLVMLIFGQVAMPEPDGPRNATVQQKQVAEVELRLKSPDEDRIEKSRKVLFAGGAVEVDTYAWPIIGDPEAEFVVIDVMDYTCEYCRDASHFLDQARQQYDGKLAVIVMPLPLSDNCNAYVPETLPEHESACQLAYLAINLWRMKPEEYEAFHHWLFEGEDFKNQEEALAYLDERFGKEFVDELINDNAPAGYINEALRLADPERENQLFGLMPAIVGKTQISEGAFSKLDEIMQPFEFDFGPPAKK
ncbi:thioredoxin domain-containing protein [Blastopirellula sp. JC732]|uniref:Thioredoxin domain-containing protein n=1 Tax=Blastopirellula sediminis TaxID=2894196 RepID=A0A9X1SE50_9BACT|nr:vitamin K epoxide reductase family protein [Blastopirellula sediminis]MCC9607822.1 thioredoxin domain-containing protein [Blastopirellula sediminis]MCC9627385.1 thioredoxin domain-containing protein [Blastopirellula sediminis]